MSLLLIFLFLSSAADLVFKIEKWSVGFLLAFLILSLCMREHQTNRKKKGQKYLRSKNYYSKNVGLLVKTNKSENGAIQPMGLEKGRLRFGMLGFWLTAKIKLLSPSGDPGIGLV